MSEALARVLTDHRRHARTGIAEAIYGPGKTALEIASIGLSLVASRHEAGEDDEWPVLATRLVPSQIEHVLREVGASASPVTMRLDPEAGLLEFAPSAAPRPRGVAAVLSAGTTDREPAAEAAAVLRAYGAEVIRFDDVGVAGLHRLVSAERLAALARARVIVVVAGMEGALPTVVAGLVAAPVIGVPSPVGYGVAEGGRAALSSMLASCAPGLAVVNIGNGFGAAVLAVKILQSGAAPR